MNSYLSFEEQTGVNYWNKIHNMFRCNGNLTPQDKLNLVKDLKNRNYLNKYYINKYCTDLIEEFEVEEADNIQGFINETDNLCFTEIKNPYLNKKREYKKKNNIELKKKKQQREQLKMSRKRNNQ